MKGIGGIALLAVAVLAAYIFFGDQITALLQGGSVDPGAVDVPKPDVNDAAGKARDAGDAASDEVSSWTPETWKIIVLALTSLGATYLWFKSPKFKYITIGVFVAIIAVVAFA